MFNKCLIDNWSIEQSAALTYFDYDFYLEKKYDFISDFGGLSNLINAVLLYENPCFLETGNEYSWKKFTKFSGLLEPYLSSEKPIVTNPDLNWYINTEDKGANYYLLNSKYLKADIFVSEVRSTKIMEKGLSNIDNNLIDILNGIDREINNKIQPIENQGIKYGITNNFILPSLTHYVLSQASSRNDLFEVLLQIKKSKKISNINKDIIEMHQNINSYTLFRKELNNVLKKEFNEDFDSNTSLSIGLNVLFLSFEKTFNVDIFNRKTYLSFLKDIVACRTEVYGLNNHIERIFGVDIKKNL